MVTIEAFAEDDYVCVTVDGVDVIRQVITIDGQGNIPDLVNGCHEVIEVRFSVVLGEPGSLAISRVAVACIMLFLARVNDWDTVP